MPEDRKALWLLWELSEKSEGKENADERDGDDVELCIVCVQSGNHSVYLFSYFQTRSINALSSG